MKKIFKILITIIAITLILSTVCFANNVNADIFKPSGNPNDPEMVKIGQYIISIAQIIGTIASIVILAMLAISIMLAAPDQKAQLKQRLTPYIIGAVMLFSIVNLLSIMYDIFN